MIEQKGAKMSMTKTPAPKPSILLVDDDENMLGILERFVELLECSADKAQTGEDAIRLFKKGSYCAVISDIYHPKGNGYELARGIRLLDSDVPLIACSGNGIESTALQAGFDVFLEKPFEARNLLRAIVSSVRQSGNAELADEMTRAGAKNGWVIEEEGVSTETDHH